MTAPSIQVGFLVYPQMTPLDVVGPAQVLSAVPGANVHFVWKTLEPITTDAGFAIVPTTKIEDCPALDVLCVTGGFGQAALMNDQRILKFIRSQAQQARYVTSVCSGSLLLGAAGVLEGYCSTCHWALHDRLSDFGATPVKQRVVRDRNRLSGGGVTAGIDFGLTLAAELAGEQVARSIQLALEYDPQPPFDSGSPDRADGELVAELERRFERFDLPS